MQQTQSEKIEQANLFGGFYSQEETSPFDRLSVVGNMTEKAKEVSEGLDPEVRREIFHFIENSSRPDAFAMLRIVTKLKESRIERTVDDSGNDVDVCSECGHKSRIYRRRIRLVHVQDLVRLYRLGGMKEYFHIRDFSDRAKSTDFFIVELFGLAERKKNDEDPTKKDLGFWRLSMKGIGFLKGEEKIPEFLEVKENKIVGKSKNKIDVESSIPKKFDYQEIFAGVES